jgi:cell wall-associated NlpC family hydrolase
MTVRIIPRARILLIALCAGLVAAGCISSTVRYSVPVEKPKEQVKPLPPKPKQRPAPKDEDDFGALLDDPAETPPAPAQDDSRLERVVNDWIGTPYHYGGMSKAGIDCSGLVCMIFRELGEYRLPHSSEEMRKIGSPVPLSHVKLGDILFFRDGLKRVDHVGIYLGNDEFVHASSKAGVIRSSMSDDYYRSRFIEARRILP